MVSIVIDRSDVKQVVTPAGERVTGRDGTFTVPVMDGQYLLVGTAVSAG